MLLRISWFMDSNALISHALAATKSPRLHSPKSCQKVGLLGSSFSLPAVSVCITIHNRILDSAHHQMTFLCRCGRRVSATVQSIVAWSSSNCRPEIRRSPSGLTFVIWRTVFSLVLMSNLGDHLSHSVLPLFMLLGAGCARRIPFAI
jgi:hypothetical protein